MKLDFYKSEGKWYVDLPTWEGAYEDLEMVNGADDFLEILSHRLNKNRLSFELWLSEPDIPHGKLSKVAQDQNGATYQVHTCLYYQSATSPSSSLMDSIPTLFTSKSKIDKLINP